MLQAMYRVEIPSDLGDAGYGVAVFKEGRILGGDSSSIYVGSYEIENGLLKVDVKVTNDRSAPTSIGNAGVFHLNGEAKFPNDEFLIKEFIVHGAIIENPSRKMAVRFTRRA